MNTREQVMQGCEPPSCRAPHKNHSFWADRYDHCKVLGGDECIDLVDSALFQYVQGLFLGNLLRYHNTPIRFVDTSAANISAPEQSWEMEKGVYIKEIKNAIAQNFPWSNSECVEPSVW